jgi:16S rRNA (uracil1498-N3)-methyltransferase
MVQYYFFKGVLEIGQEFSLRGLEVARIRNTGKLRLSDKFCFQDQNNKRYLCEIIKLKSRFLQFFVQKEQAFTKKDFFFNMYLPILPKLELHQFLFQATELGVSNFYFFESQYSRKITNITKKRKSIWEQVVLRACENSGVGDIPNILFCSKLKETLQDLKTQNIPFCVLQPESNSAQKFPVVDSKLAVFVGPKKGFSAQELKLMDCPQVTLGGNWLKPQTAALGAIAIFQHLFGDFQFSLNKK